MSPGEQLEEIHKHLAAAAGEVSLMLGRKLMSRSGLEKADRYTALAKAKLASLREEISDGE